MALDWLPIPLWIPLVGISAVLIYKYLTKNFDYWTKQGVPGPKPIPLLGTSLEMLKAGNFTTLDLEYAKKYGKIVGLFDGREPGLASSDPEFVRQAFIKEFTSMPNRRQIAVGGMFDYFLTALNDDHWKHVRSSLTPTFTTGKLKQMKHLVDECAQKLATHLCEITGEGDVIFDPKEVLGAYTMDVINKTAFGIEVDSYGNDADLTVRHANKIMRRDKQNIYEKIITQFRFLAFLALPASLMKRLQRFGFSVFPMESVDYFENFANHILNDRATESSGNRKDFIQLCSQQLVDDPMKGDAETLVDDKGFQWTYKGLTRNEIVANAIIFFLAGYDTTSNSLLFMVYELAMHPEIQQKAYEEIQRHRGSSEMPTYDELMKMEYVDWIIDEALRLYPPAPRLERKVSKTVEIDGITLTPGMLVGAAVYAIHHDPEIWHDPFTFDPERFSPENKAGRHQCAWIPFGVGNRNCIGMRLALLELKIALVQIISLFKLEPCEDTPPRPLEIGKTFQMVPAKPTKMKITKRQ